MKKERITFEDLALISFLKFNRLDSMDITVLKNMISDKFELVVDDTTDDYFLFNDGSVIIENNYVEKIYKNIDRQLLADVEKTNLYNFVNNISIVEFILRKIKIMGKGIVLVEELDNNFSTFQIAIFERLYKKGYINEYSHKDAIYGDYLAIKLTKRGELYLYIIDNKEQIDKFSNMLVEKGYDSLLISSFLVTQDLEKSIDDILTLDNFVSFLNCYGLNGTNVRKKKKFFNN